MPDALSRSVIKRYVKRLETSCRSVERNMAVLAEAYGPEYETYHNYVDQLGRMFVTFHEMVKVLGKKV